MPYRKSCSKRRQTGAAGALFFLALVLVIIGLGAFAVDFAHVLTVRNEL